MAIPRGVRGRLSRIVTGMMMGQLLTLSLIGGASASQSGANTVQAAPVGSAANSIDVDGVTRTYRLFVPPGLDGPAPLVVMLHGGGGSGTQAEMTYGWNRLARQEQFVVAYPDALGANIPAWNTEGGCCGASGRNGVDDVGFITAMVAQIEKQVPIDPSRVYAAGISNGGILAYTLACRTNLFAAIGPVSATMLNDCPDPSPTSVIHIHGLKDTSIRFDGEPGEGMATIDGPPVPEVIADWRKIDNCDPPIETTAGVVTTSIATCANGRAVELITIADGEHGWPGASKSSAKGTAGGKMPSQAVDSTSTLWEFFQAHPKS